MSTHPVPARLAGARLPSGATDEGSRPIPPPPGLPDAWLPDAQAVMDRVSGENFPVASRLLGRRTREHLLALYGFARLVDDVGDESAGDRREALDWLQSELERAFAGTAHLALMRRLTPTLDACALPREPFLRLIEANRVDQRVTRYQTWAQLLAYCHLSANPIGELVLGVLGAATPRRIALSDSICTGLQLAEHWQDVAEDLARGRVYLPAEDLERFGCSPADLAADRASDRLRRLIAFESQRARELLDRGTPLIGMLRGRSRLAVAAFVGGGRAALAAIARADHDVLTAAPRAGRGLRVASSLAALAEGSR
jgi:squalene synthase HpnC